MSPIRSGRARFHSVAPFGSRASEARPGRFSAMREPSALRPPPGLFYWSSSSTAPVPQSTAPRPAPTQEKMWIRGYEGSSISPPLSFLPSNTPSSAPTPHNYNYNTCIYLASYVYTCVLSRTPNSMPLPLPIFTLLSLPNRTPSFSRVRITPPAHAASSNEPTTTR